MPSCFLIISSSRNGDHHHVRPPSICFVSFTSLTRLSRIIQIIRMDKINRWCLQTITLQRLSKILFFILLEYEFTQSNHPNAPRYAPTPPPVMIPLAQRVGLGTSRETAWKIVKSGFATVATIDEGYFGKGIYFTSDVNYAKYYAELAAGKSRPRGKQCLILSVVIPGNIYPVTEDHKGPDSLLSKPCKGVGYQSHFTNVHSTRDGNFGCVCNPPQPDNYDELVVFQDAQALPLFIIEC